mgnify:FL=1
MKIVQVEYRRLRTFGSYENETVGCTALVDDGEVADAVFESVRLWVDNRLGDDQERRDLDRRVTELRWQERDLKARIERMQAKWSEIMAFLDRFGIERPGDVPADLSEILSPDDRSWEEDQDLKTLPF